MELDIKLEAGTPRADNTVLDYRGKPRVQTENNDPSKTDITNQHLGDINHVLRQYSELGLMQSLQQADVQFLDISEVPDYADAVRILKDAEREFLTYPSKYREIFNHSVAEWLDTAHDKEKQDALVAAGFAEAPMDGNSAVRTESGDAGGQPDSTAEGGDTTTAGSTTDRTS